MKKFTEVLSSLLVFAALTTCFAACAKEDIPVDDVLPAMPQSPGNMQHTERDSSEIPSFIHIDIEDLF